MKNKPMQDKQDIQKHPDKHIDQDYEGYPHAPSREEQIKPATDQQKKSAAVNVKDGEKKFKTKPEEKDNGSANAFERTENVSDDE
jgi:hypothetical protein